MKTHELEKGHVTTKSTEQAEVIASISQELRQPLSSIVGYTDLLLGESVGILGALQRKFVERIKASTERINSLTDDMIQITTLEAELNDLKFEPVDLNVVIDNAMSYTSAQVREKNISMHLDLPKKLSPIQADREALQQILIHLLQNAGAATPFEGTVRLKVQTQKRGKDGIHPHPSHRYRGRHPGKRSAARLHPPVSRRQCADSGCRRYGCGTFHYKDSHRSASRTHLGRKRTRALAPHLACCCPSAAGREEPESQRKEIMQSHCAILATRWWWL